MSPCCSTIMFIILLATLPLYVVGDHCAGSSICPALVANVEALLVSCLPCSCCCSYHDSIVVAFMFSSRMPEKNWDAVLMMLAYQVLFHNQIIANKYPHVCGCSPCLLLNMGFQMQDQGLLFAPRRWPLLCSLACKRTMLAIEQLACER